MSDFPLAESAMITEVTEPEGPVVSFTGHRPPRMTMDGLLKPYSVEQLEAAVAVIMAHLTSLPVLPKVVKSGGALLTDQGGAIAGFRLGIPVHMYLPFDDMDAKWPEDSKKLFRRILEKAAEVRIISPGGYRPWKMEARNDALVEDADQIVAFFDGKRNGGTYHALQYAQQLKKPVTNLWPEWQAYAPVVAEQQRIRAAEEAARAAAAAEAAA